MGLGDRRRKNKTRFVGSLCTHVRLYQPEKIDGCFAHFTDRAKKTHTKFQLFSLLDLSGLS